MLKLVIWGADGRVGEEILKNIAFSDDLTLTLAVVAEDSPKLNQETSISGVFYISDSFHTQEIDHDGEKEDVAIDFSVPAATMACLEYCTAKSLPLVIGTTGHSKKEYQQIAQAAKDIPIILASNMSLAVNTSFLLAEMASRALGEDYDVEIIEKHHKHKIDAPSGTALEMGRRVAAVRSQKLKEIIAPDRSSKTEPRASGTIGFHSVRGGEIIGEHELLFISSDEEISISHKVHSRAVFARGALRASRWLAQQNTPGLYTIEDTIKLAK